VVGERCTCVLEASHRRINKVSQIAWCSGRTSVIRNIDSQILDMPGVDAGRIRADRGHRLIIWLSYDVSWIVTLLLVPYIARRPWKVHRLNICRTHRRCVTTVAANGHGVCFIREIRSHNGRRRSATALGIRLSLVLKPVRLNCIRQYWE
jgi:hypothetical protein